MEARTPCSVVPTAATTLSPATALDPLEFVADGTDALCEHPADAMLPKSSAVRGRDGLEIFKAGYPQPDMPYSTGNVAVAQACETRTNLGGTRPEP